MKIELSGRKSTALKTVESLVQELLENKVITQEQFGAILMSLSEAVTNAIEHGNLNDESKSVILEYSIEDHSVEFSVTDQGKGYVVEMEKDVDFFESNYPGLALIHELADQVTFNEAKNSIQMQFNVISAQERLSSQRTSILLKARSKTMNQSARS